MPAKKRPVLKKISNRVGNTPEYLFFCPGCGVDHWFKTDGQSPRWTFNGDMVKPTISPSVLVNASPHRCHFYMTKGALLFLADCTHLMAGKTVPLEPWDD